MILARHGGRGLYPGSRDRHGRHRTRCRTWPNFAVEGTRERSCRLALSKMLLPPLAHPERVAAPSIRGYLYQTIGIALRWVALPADELLLCEGDEDAEHYLVDEQGVVREVTQVQFKDVGGTLSA